MIAEPAFLTLRRDIINRIFANGAEIPASLRLNLERSGKPAGSFPVRPGKSNRLVISATQRDLWPGQVEQVNVLYGHRLTECELAISIHRPYLQAGTAAREWLERNQPVICSLPDYPGLVFTDLPVRHKAGKSLHFVVDAGLARAVSLTVPGTVNMHFHLNGADIIKK